MAYELFTTYSLDAALAYPHYSVRAWERGFPIYKNPNYSDRDRVGDAAYSDRMWEWDYQIAQAANDWCKRQSVQPNTARHTQTFIEHYYGKKIDLKYIIGQVNLSNGYPVFYYAWDWDLEVPIERIDRLQNIIAFEEEWLYNEEQRYSQFSDERHVARTRERFEKRHQEMRNEITEMEVLL